MKNFLDLQATDLDIRVSVHALPVLDGGAPWLSLSINDRCCFNDWLEQPITVTSFVPLLEPIDISITMKHKVYSTEETAVKINSLQIDQFEVVPRWTHLASYHNDHDVQSPTSYLGFNGTWRLQIPEPFYQWRHRVTGQGWLLAPVTAGAGD
jgi:hypothetical protein